MAVDDNILREHLERPYKKNATYIRYHSQNEMIDIIGNKNDFQADLVQEIKDAGFHTILADEVTTANEEIVSICDRFVDSRKNIREEFIEFVHMYLA